MAVEGYGFKDSALKALYEPMLDGGIMNLGNGGLGVGALYGMQDPTLTRNGPAPKGPTPSI